MPLSVPQAPKSQANQTKAHQRKEETGLQA